MLQKNRYTPIPMVIILSACIVLWATAINGFYQNEYSDIIVHTLISRAIAKDGIPFSEIEQYKHILAYPLYHVTVSFIHIISSIDYEKVSVAVQALANAASVLILRRIIIDKLAKSPSYYIDFVSLCSVLFLCVRSPLTYWVYYYKICGPNPIHNPTFIFVRPFGLMTVYWYLSFLEDYEVKKPIIKSSVLWSVFLFLSVCAKPSFALAFLTAMGVHIFIKMLSRKDLRIGIYSFSAVIPTLILMVIQLLYIKRNSEALETIIVFGSFAGFSLPRVIAITLSLIPEVILLFDYKKVRESNLLQLACFAFIISWVQMYFLTNGLSGDYSWGYDLAVGFIVPVFMATLSIKNNKLISKIIAYSAIILYSYQTYTGIMFLLKCIEKKAYNF